MEESPCLYILDDEGVVFKEVDLKEPLSVALSFMVNDIMSLSQPRNSFSKNVSLLGTDKTNGVLKWVFRVDKVGRSMLHKRMKARLVQHGKDLLGTGGVLEIVDIVLEPSTGVISYECDLTSQGYNWLRALELLKFCDANLGNHVIGEALVRNSWDREGKNGTPYGYDYIGCTYFPVHYGWWLDRDSVSLFDLRPHCYFKWLLEKAFETIGYTLTGEYVESDDFAQRVLPFGKGRFGPSEDEVNTLYRTFDVVPNSYDGNILPTYFEATPAIRNIWYVSTWTQPFTYEMRIKVTIPEGSYDPGASGVCDICIFIDDVLANSVCMNPPALSFEVTWQGCVTKGSRVKVKVEPSTCVAGPPPSTMVFLEGVQIFFSPVSWRCFLGDTIELCDTLDPSLNFKKIFLGLVHSVGLVVTTDEENKKVELTRISQYYKTKPHEDWSSRVDCSKTGTQSLVLDCRNFKIAYLADSSDKALDVECTEFAPNEIFSQTIKNDIDEECLIEFRNPTFAPMNSDGWQFRGEGGLHGVTPETYSTMGTIYLALDAFNTYNWSVDEWTQPYTCHVRVMLHIEAPLAGANYHRWGIEVNGDIVAEGVYDNVTDLDLVWFGCLNEGDIMKFRVIDDTVHNTLPSFITIGNAQASFVVDWRWIDFNDVADQAYIKHLFLTAQTKREYEKTAAEMEPRDVIAFNIVPRIALFKGLVEDADINWTGTGSISWKYDDGSGVTVESQLPYAYFYDFYEGTRPSLAFNTITRKTVSPEGKGSALEVESVGVARNGYGLLLDSMGNGLVLKLWVRLTVVDISNLRFDTPKYLGGIGLGTGVFLLNKVSDWNPSSELGLCEFIQINLDPTF